mmetsp:Transcript_2278/g.2556  ORF Transcript_2278/g.2556 Transcript_2278/m.2556 type:complete len:439 (+) Transcript_2278:18-1334(+)
MRDVVFLTLLITVLCTQGIWAQLPTITCRNITTVGCDNVDNPPAQLTSGCNLPIEDNLQIINLPDLTCNRVDTFRYTARDLCNDTMAICEFQVTRNQPNTPPMVLSSVQTRWGSVNDPLQCDGSTQPDVSANSLGMPTFFDFCDGLIQPQETNTPTVMDVCVTRIDRLFTATDSCGDSGSLSVVIFHVTDGNPPTCLPPLQAVEVMDLDPNNLPGPGPLLGVPTVSDDCSNATFTYSDMITSVSGLRTFVQRTFECVDACGNTATADQTITVVQSPPPTTSPPTTLVPTTLPPTTLPPTTLSPTTDPPTDAPTAPPTTSPTATPTSVPTATPTASPTAVSAPPTEPVPTSPPTFGPTFEPTTRSPIAPGTIVTVRGEVDPMTGECRCFIWPCDCELPRGPCRCAIDSWYSFTLWPGFNTQGFFQVVDPTGRSCRCDLP